MGDCFIIMPISTPSDSIDRYGGDTEHFANVLTGLLVPAVEDAGFTPITPVAAGDDVIHATIIKNLAAAEMVLCDLSAFNPNVFFELGVRTALNKPTCLIRDEHTNRLPFDVGIVNTYTYLSQPGFKLVTQIKALAEHIRTVANTTDLTNSLWSVFGVQARAEFSPDDQSTEATLDLVLREVSALRGEVTVLRRSTDQERGQYFRRLFAPAERVSIQSMDRKSFEEWVLASSHERDVFAPIEPEGQQTLPVEARTDPE